MDGLSKKKALRVLVLAEAANPEWTSVPLLGWSHTLALSRACHVHLATQVRNQEAIERYGWTEGKEFTAIDTEKVDAPIYRFGLMLRGGDKLAWTITTALQGLTYIYFEKRCWHAFQQDLEQGKYDIVHRVTPVSPTNPTYLASKLKKLNIPFIVGPLNGGVAWPKEHRDLQHKEREWLSYVRFFYKFLPGYKSLRRDSTVLLAGSQATLKQLPDYAQSKSVFMPENAIDTERFPSSQHELQAITKPLKACFIGRLVPYKCADLAILGLKPFLEKGDVTLDIFGSGPEENALRGVIKDNNLGHSAQLMGFVDHSELKAKLLDYSLFVFPSVREFGGGAVLEAMALGIVPIVVDYAGPGEIVDESCGYKIPMGDKQSIIKGVHSIVTAIQSNPEVLLKKRAACLDRVRRLYTWDKKAEQVMEVYDWALGRAEKPIFDF